MKILLNDFGGYSFTAQLARGLARHGHQVTYTFCNSLQSTPRGSLDQRESDPEHLEIHPITLSKPLDKYSLIKRRRQEMEFGCLLAKKMANSSHDVIISANTPLDAQSRIWKQAKLQGALRVFWLQDVLSLATSTILQKKIPVAGRLIGTYYENLEKSLIRQSNCVVTISPDFEAMLQRWGVAKDSIHVIPNWAPLDEIELGPKRNSWSIQRNLDDRFVFLYSGTLSFKHDPRVLANLAKHIQSQGGVVVVKSQGLGANWLEKARQDDQIENLFIEPFGPYAEMPLSFAAADVLVALLDRDASNYSVPSKILSYMCAGRPLLLSVASSNFASTIVSKERMGFVCEPGQEASFLSSAKSLIEDKELRLLMGTRARAYAERTFQLEKLVEQFDLIIEAESNCRFSN